MPRGDQRVRAGHPRPHDGNRGVPRVRSRPRHRRLRLVAAQAERGPDREGPRAHRRIDRPPDRTRGPLEVDRLPAVQDDRRRRAEPLLRPLPGRRVQAPRDRTPEARHPGVHQHLPGGDARGAQPRVDRGGIPRAHPGGRRHPPLDREVRPRPCDPGPPVHPHEERVPHPDGVRRPHGDRGGPEAVGEARLPGRTWRIRAVRPDGRSGPRLRAEGAGRRVPPRRRGTGRLGVHQAPRPLRPDAPRAVRIHGGQAVRDVQGPLRPLADGPAGSGDRDPGGLQVRGGEPIQGPRGRRVQETVADPGGSGGRARGMKQNSIIARTQYISEGATLDAGPTAEDLEPESVWVFLTASKLFCTVGWILLPFLPVVFGPVVIGHASVFLLATYRLRPLHRFNLLLVGSATLLTLAVFGLFLYASSPGGFPQWLPLAGLMSLGYGFIFLELREEYDRRCRHLPLPWISQPTGSIF